MPNSHFYAHEVDLNNAMLDAVFHNLLDKSQTHSAGTVAFVVVMPSRRILPKFNHVEIATISGHLVA